jgi:hypothetical protein
MHATNIKETFSTGQWLDTIVNQQTTKTTAIRHYLSLEVGPAIRSEKEQNPVIIMFSSILFPAIPYPVNSGMALFR